MASNIFSVLTQFSVNDQMTKALERMSAASAKFGSTTERSMRRASSASSMFGSITSSIVAATGITNALDLIKQGVVGIITATADLEMSTTNFKVLTGSIENARNVVNDLRQFAAVTPFSFTDIEPTAKMLMGFGVVTQGTLIPTLKMLGDVSMGSAEKLDRITLAFSQIVSGGRAYQQDINQLVNAGVPIMKALSQQWGVPIAKVREMIKAGRATGTEIQKAFKMMTSQGGMFFNGMEEGSKTLIGRWATLRDNINMIATSIGNAMLPQMKSLVEQAGQVIGQLMKWVHTNRALIGLYFADAVKSITEAARTLWPILKGIGQALIFIYPIAKQLVPVLIGLAAAWAVNAAILKVVAIYEFVSALYALSKATTVITAAQWLWNVAMTANPIGVIIMAIAALIGALVYLEIKFKSVSELMSNVMEGWKVYARIWDDMFSGPSRHDTIGISEDYAKRPPVTPPAQMPAQLIAMQRAGVEFQGQLNIAGAPEGSTVKSTTTGAPPLRVALMGAQ